MNLQVKFWKKAIVIWLLTPFVLAATNNIDPSPAHPEQAFVFSVTPTKTDSILAQWRIQPAYYLYKNRLKFTVLSPKSAAIGRIQKPPGIEKNDAILGKHYVYEKKLTIPIPLLNPTNEPLQLLVTYQGCSAWGFCYPPITKLVKINNRLPLNQADISISDYKRSESTKPTTNATTINFNSAQDKAQTILTQKNPGLALLLFFGFGILLTFTPCVLPMIPILSGIIVGQKDIKTIHAFSLSLAYVLGMSITFALAGFLVGLIGQSIQATLQAPWILVLFSGLFVVLALSLFGFYDLKLPQRWQQKMDQLGRKPKTGTYFGAVTMGILSTLIISPCVSAPLVGALAYIGQTGNAIFGTFALFFMGLGMGLPLLIIGTSFGKLLPHAGAWMNTIKSIFGILLLAVAIWMLARILPGPLSLILWALLAVVCAVYLGAFNPLKTRFGKLWQGFGIALLIYGGLLFIGAAMGHHNPLMPLQFNPNFSTKNTNSTKLSFTPIHSLADLNHQLSLNQGKLIMLDFYADWCVSCKQMEMETFQNAEVKKALNHFVLLQADVTANNSADQALEKHFGVIAPPTILFFDRQGNEITSARIVGEIGPKAFFSHLQKIRVFSVKK